MTTMSMKELFTELMNIQNDERYNLTNKEETIEERKEKFNFIKNNTKSLDCVKNIEGGKIINIKNIQKTINKEIKKEYERPLNKRGKYLFYHFGTERVNMIDYKLQFLEQKENMIEHGYEYSFEENIIYNNGFKNMKLKRHTFFNKDSDIDEFDLVRFSIDNGYMTNSFNYYEIVNWNVKNINIENSFSCGQGSISDNFHNSLQTT